MVADDGTPAQWVSGPKGRALWLPGPGGVAEWLRQGPAKPCTPVRFRPPPPTVTPPNLRRFPGPRARLPTQVRGWSGLAHWCDDGRRRGRCAARGGRVGRRRGAAAARRARRHLHRGGVRVGRGGAALVGPEPPHHRRVLQRQRHPLVPPAGAGRAAGQRGLGAGAPVPARRSSWPTPPCSPRSTRASGTSAPRSSSCSRPSGWRCRSTGWRTTPARRPSRSSATCCSRTTPCTSRRSASGSPTPRAPTATAGRCRRGTTAPRRHDGVSIVNIGVGPVERQDDHRPRRRAAARRADDDRPLRRAAEPPGHRRLRAGHRLPARRPRPRRRAADRRAGDARTTTSTATCSTRSSSAAPGSGSAPCSRPTTATGSSTSARRSTPSRRRAASRSTWSRPPSRPTGSATGCPNATLLCVSDKPLHGMPKLERRGRRVLRRVPAPAPRDRPGRHRPRAA